MSSAATAPPQRELVYCHQCRNEWYRDEHGIICPRCDGDFTEIIENHDDPTFSAPLGMPDLSESDEDEFEHFMHHHHAHRAAAPIFGFGIPPPIPERPRTQAEGQEGGHNHGPPPLSDLLNTIYGLIVPGARPLHTPVTPGSGSQSPNQERRPGQQAEQGQQDQGGHNHGEEGRMGRQGLRSPRVFHTERTIIAGPGGARISTRFSYDGDAALLANPFGGFAVPRPEIRRDGGQRVEELQELLERTFGVRGREGTPGERNEDPMVDILGRLMGLVAPAGPVGDYVLNQSDFDRLVTELMEQHQGNAPPPAPKEVLETLPKIKVTEQMVQANEDCAVCKEDLVLDEELVQLPCKHYYHEFCVKKWLESHDTCPICRRPTAPDRQNMDNKQSPANTANSQRNSPSNGPSSSNANNQSAGDSSARREASPGSSTSGPMPGGWPGWSPNSRNNTQGNNDNF